ncbi:MAG: hypothetical protein COU06_02905 [Candidatus Harrisonbacteria bacterium CG10_big_fil_rev_8_21_14_0_10_38_8]|uniref:Polymerase/histidinol phosphatase N-terminal domain-containing protein n=1 Tax=Candidatus Harrisonbacteria bacterium CG10_big_fil_rev_8_21_14_0_10_38_8 TaxID=1974582 RepID=A0A2M6WJE8_9BACT|nr:MAG: hypothetical protein COU06_02905 [Candidatus Harrisonbacteria bacterium CG10_big_fil_rev_8_21_14_0_10_38_8]
MKLKANLHLHSNEDPLDKETISYTAKQAIKEAKKHNFDVLAFTLHTRYIHSLDLVKYAKNKGVLLISGIEQYIDGRHVLILNCNPDVEEVKTFTSLREYKKNNPEIFIIAPHPYFQGPISLREKLEENIDLFDAVEHSWFFTKLINRNKKAKEVAKKYNLPLISTSDTHKLKYLNNNYITVETKEKTTQAFFKDIKEGNFTNHIQPARIIQDMIYEVGIKQFLLHPFKFFFGEQITRQTSESKKYKLLEQKY